MKMRYSTASVVITATLLVTCATSALAQVATRPPSSISNPGDAGQFAHTNLEVLQNFATSGNPSVTRAVTGPPFPGYLYQTPASVACIYSLVSGGGCDPNIVTVNPSGGAKAIAIVDAYDDPNAYSDLQFFSSQFGVAAISPSTFQVVFAPFGGATPGSCTGSATRPPVDPTGGWEIEESLDIEWSHAMAPSAKLYLVEAQTNFFSDLLCAVTVASNLVNAAGGGEVSMSWGGGEFPFETSIDPVFTTPKVVYFASAGDSPGVIYPSASPNVVSVGGTSLSMNLVTGNFLSETTWQDAGGGPSFFESRPSYQDRGDVKNIVGTQRGTPDISLDANPYTGVWVWDSLGGGWYVVGGTSVSSPTWAGIVNAAGGFSTSSNAELTQLYGDGRGNTFNNIQTGTCGPYVAYSAGGPPYNFCVGLGSPQGYKGK